MYYFCCGRHRRNSHLFRNEYVQILDINRAIVQQLRDLTGIPYSVYFTVFWNPDLLDYNPLVVWITNILGVINIKGSIVILIGIACDRVYVSSHKVVKSPPKGLLQAHQLPFPQPCQICQHCHLHRSITRSYGLLSPVTSLPSTSKSTHLCCPWLFHGGRC